METRIAETANLDSRKIEKGRQANLINFQQYQKKGMNSSNLYTCARMATIPKKYWKNDTKYIPDSTESDCQNCCLPLNESGKCFICDSSHMEKVVNDLQS